MAMKRKSVLSDPRWIELVIKYRYDFEMGANDIFDMQLSDQQVEVTDSVQQSRSATTVTSGHGTGKSMLAAVMLMLFVMLFPYARGILLANKIGQVRKGVFKYIKMAWVVAVNRLPWLAQYFICTETEFYCIEGKGVWEISMKGFRAGNEESIAGEHQKYLFWIIDEASGVSDKALGIVRGSLTEADNRILLMSQPTRPAGHFYESHHRLAKTPDNPNGLYTAICLNSEESPFVVFEAIRDKLIEYGGRDSVEYQIKVLGKFPDKVEDFLLGRKEVVGATKEKVYLHKDWGWVLLCDVGNFRDSSVANLCKISGNKGMQRRIVNWHIQEFSREFDPLDFGDWINNNYIKSGLYNNISIVIDGDGIGAQTISILEREGVNVQSIRWGKPMFTEKEKGRFGNQRAYANVMAKFAVNQGRMRVDNHASTIDQASRIPVIIDELGKWRIMKKENMKKQKIPSPDRWDTYCFGFLADYRPANVEMQYDQDKVRTKAFEILDKYDDDIDSEF